VPRGPWATRRHTLREVAAIQGWCDCGAAKPVVDPHRDGMEVLLRNGSTVRVAPARAFRPGAEPVEYPNELRLSPAQAKDLRAALPPDKVREIVRAPSSD
jgi:hypothetical protein